MPKKVWIKDGGFFRLMDVVGKLKVNKGDFDLLLKIREQEGDYYKVICPDDERCFANSSSAVRELTNYNSVARTLWQMEEMLEKTLKTERETILRMQGPKA